MARPREFDEQRALDAAMRAFWRAGYEATSTEALCRATGLGRSSIYNSFTSKHALFERALDRYTSERAATLAELEAADLPAREKLRVLLWESVRPPPDDPTGCLVVTSMVELGQRDPQIAEHLQRDQQRRLAAIVAIIEAGRRAAEIEDGRDAVALAHFLMATISGMRVMACGGTDAAALAQIADTALAAI